MTARGWIAAFLMLQASWANADDAQIVQVEFIDNGESFRFSVTLSHGDTGWDDYADGWRIEDVDGTVLGTRVLAHPHVNEQPFTRSLGGVVIPGSVDTVYIRAKTLTDGWADARTAVEIR